MLVSIMGGYGHLYVTGGTTAQGSLSGTPAKLTCFANDGISDDVTVSNANDRITITTAGDYMVGYSLTFEDDTATPPHTYMFPIYKNGSTTVLEAQHTCDDQNKTYNVACTGLLTLAATDYLEIYVYSDGTGDSVTVAEGSFWVRRIA